jgi:nitrogen regulatory protein P-II 1
VEENRCHRPDRIAGGGEERLKEVRVRGISVTRGKGYGAYANFFTSDWSAAHARREIYCNASSAAEIVNAIMDAGQTGVRETASWR